MWEAIGQLLPFALGIALSPFPVIAVILVLSTPSGRTAGLVFAVGWLVGLGLLTAVLLLLVNGADDSESSRTVTDLLRIALGVACFVGAGRKWRGRPADGADPVTPAWMAKLDGITPQGALVMGALLGGLNPKNIAIGAAATSTIVLLMEDDARSWGPALVFVVLSSLTVIGPVLATLVLGDRAAPPLESAKGFMLRNADVITMVILIIIGAKILGDGITGLAG